VSQESVEYVLPRPVSVKELTEALAPTFGLRAEAEDFGERIFYDTFDGRLHRAGVSLVHGQGRFELRNGRATEIAGLDWPRAPREMLAAALPEGRLREALQSLTDVRPVSRLAHVRVRQRPLRVLDQRHKTVVRLQLEEPVLVGAPDRELTPRLVATSIRGYDKALRDVRRRLTQELALVPASVSLQDEAAVGCGLAPGGVSSKVEVALGEDEPAPLVAAKIGRRLLEVIEVNLPGALAGKDPECLHDLRVAIRRTRALQRGLRGSFPAEPLRRFRAEFRWLQEVTGATRDLDVYLLEFEARRASLPDRNRDGLQQLLELLEERRRRERRRMVSALRSSRAQTVLSGWAELLEDLPRTAAADAARPVSQVAGAQLRRVYLAMVKAGGEIDDASPPTSLHDLRKQGKELRYLLEFFASLYPAEVITPMVRALRALQDSLGRFQDRQIQAELVHSLGEEVRTLPDGARALMAMGQLVERLDEQQAQARAEFATRFADFASAKHRALAQEVFT
jgi:CHAD domain-containing protein